VIMVEDEREKLPDDETDSAETESNASKNTGFLGRLLTRRWLVIIVALSIVVHGAGFSYYQLWGKSRQSKLSPEISLGTFQFEPNENEKGRIAAAEFSLHIALLEHVDQAARDRLAARKFRVQQDVEELLRQAHSGDFDDPSLGELKRQLQEQVNETLGMRAIADVIITDLKLQLDDTQPKAAGDSNESVPWVEKP